MLEVVGEVDGGAVGAGLVPSVGGENSLVECTVEVAEADGVAVPTACPGALGMESGVGIIHSENI